MGGFFNVFYKVPRGGNAGKQSKSNERVGRTLRAVTPTGTMPKGAFHTESKKEVGGHKDWQKKPISPLSRKKLPARKHGVGKRIRG